MASEFDVSRNYRWNWFSRRLYLSVLPGSDYKFIHEIAVERLEDPVRAYMVRLQPAYGEEIRILLTKDQLSLLNERVDKSEIHISQQASYPN